MQYRNTRNSFGFLAKFFHWTSAVAFILAYIFVYYLTWFVDPKAPEVLPILNLHWAFGLLVGFLVIPRLIWKLLNVQPELTSGPPWEHFLAQTAHLGLYGFLIVMPLTGYLGTGASTDFGLFKITALNETNLFVWISNTFELSWDEFQEPIDVVHHFIGKWVAWVVVGLHVIAAFFHHWVRKDVVLVRMLPLNIKNKN